ncbi:MAG: tripartite tricarboxylate transporter substrate binding protein [Rhodospirillales bacterium]|nr:tripartite tricarboxylate transporter substrate binding protein [Rhodospirillales bacterium]
MINRNLILGAVAGAVLAATAGPVSAAGYPEKDITFIVPYKPGGGSDAQARRLQAGLEKNLGVKIRIVYKTGGGGAVGFNELHRSKGDGYTISNVVVPNIIVSAQGKDVGYKPSDFSYIGMTEKSVGALAVKKDSKFKTLEEIVAYAKKNPGKLTVAGVGSTGHSNYAELVKALGITATYVPISGGVGKMLPFIMGGHVDCGILAAAHGVKHKAKVTVLGLAGTKQSAALSAPTMESRGFKGFTMETTWGIMAPPGTPADRIAILNAALHKTTADSSVKNAQLKNGLIPMVQTPAEAKQYVADTTGAVDRRNNLLKALLKK